MEHTKLQTAKDTAYRSEPGGMTPTNSYVAGIDGLRALAVLAVLIYHLDNRLLPRGFVGVDVFFVFPGLWYRWW